VAPVVSELIADALGAIRIVPKPELKFPEVVVAELLANSQELEGLTLAV
jgi:hypothetical protein